MNQANRGWVLTQRPVGDDFDAALTLRALPMPEPDAGKLLVRSLYLSLDPANRGWMMMPTYIPAVPIGEPMWGFVLGRVERSGDPRFSPGDIVSGLGTWSDYCRLDAASAQKLPEMGGMPLYVAQSLFGLSGGTAYVGVMDIAKPKPGETLVVSGAAGSVGSLVGQIAKIQGCTVIGIAGSPDKCAWLTRELGFDHAIDYRSEDAGARLKELCPNGVDIYFDNVAGALANTVMSRIAVHGRVVLCGSMAKFSNPGPDIDLGPVLLARATVYGFILIDHFHRLEAANAALAGWLAEGRIKHRADIVDGLENTVTAFRKLFTPGAPHMGKLLVRIRSGGELGRIALRERPALGPQRIRQRRGAGRIQAGELFVGKGPAGRGEIVAQLSFIAGAKDHAGDALPAQQPVERDLRHGCTARLGDRSQGVCDVVQFRPVDRVAGHAGQRAAGAVRIGPAAAEFAGEDAEGERAPDQAADALVDPQRQQLMLGVAPCQRIIELMRDIAGAPGAVRGRQGLHQLPAGIVGAARVTDLARPDQVVERRQRLFERRQGIEAVQLVEVDIICLEPAQARLAGLDDMQTRAADIVGARSGAAPHLGRDHDLLPPVAQRMRQDFLRPALRVCIGRIEQVDPGIEAEPDQPFRLFFRGGADDGERPLSAEGHRPEAQRRDHQPAIAQPPHLHDFPPRSACRSGVMRVGVGAGQAPLRTVEPKRESV
jgi:NADPH-dependent curcumin reductase CurA